MWPSTERPLEASNRQAVGGAPTPLHALTGLRGLAALTVMLFHARQAIPHDGVRLGLQHGNLAVDIFFVLSGFVLFYTYRSTITTRSELLAYYSKRIARIYPLHLLLLIPFAFITIVPAALDGNVERLGYLTSYLVGSILLIQNWGFWPALAMNVPAWSISTEFFCYIFFPIMAIAATRLKVSTFRIVGLIILLSLALAGYFAMRDYPFARGIPETGLFRSLVGFASGIVAARLLVGASGVDPAGHPQKPLAFGALI
jgi:peptidoglycan/LPS O-acetylase OafA/YrhL